ncbi:AbrB/MazE/SpoVT family DNA-binding domain-containing protein [Candidatus Micrarchaeota archaeon]|nr:AbrB/MazE/SpoVT family DNA-binding domain-containing protein [Candidatus Micrarchaeota archaeon]
MVHMQGVIKKWGNSYGILLPKNVLEKGHFKEGQKVELLINPKTNILKKTFGMFKDFPLSGQQVKDEARRDLYDD